MESTKVFDGGNETAAQAESVAAQKRLFDYVPTLDGWRGLSILGVIWFHCFHNGLPEGGIIGKVAEHGDVGVDVFFAISGFLICGKLLGEMETSGTISLRRFYVRRFFRILPAIWVYLLILGLLREAGWVESHRWEFGSTLLFVRNYFPLFHDQVFGTFTAQFWSLAVEEHFYLLWPITMVILGPKVRRIGWAALLAAVAVTVWKVMDYEHGWLIPFGTSINAKTDTRIDALLWGCLAAVVYPWVREHFNPAALRQSTWVLAGLSVFVAGSHIQDVSMAKSVLFPALLVCTAACPDSLLGKFLELPEMKWIGRLSYSIYIWQQICLFPTTNAHSPLRAIEHMPYNIGIAILLAMGSYYLVEHPMIQFGHRLIRRRAKAKPVAAYS